MAKLEGKPVLASWMGGVDVAAGEAILNRANIPTFPYPDTAARAFQYMWSYTYNLRGLYETPIFRRRDRRAAGPGGDREEARMAGLLTSESKQVLAGYGIPTSRRSPPPTRPWQRRNRSAPRGAQAALGNHHPQDRRWWST
jgi:acetyltransferase